MFYMSKFLFICGAVGMVIISALRFTVVDLESVHQCIIDAYFLFLGLIVGLSQLNIKYFKNNFRFLNYNWGKFALSLFLATMSFSSGEESKKIAFVQYIITIYFLIVAVLFLVLSFIDRPRDLKQWELDKIDIMQNSPLFEKFRMEQNENLVQRQAIN